MAQWILKGMKLKNGMSMEAEGYISQKINMLIDFL